MRALRLHKRVYWCAAEWWGGDADGIRRLGRGPQSDVWADDGDVLKGMTVITARPCAEREHIKTLRPS